jgi:hypothetical protein
MTGDAADPGWWAPIVYARTRDVDLWWRALPPQMRHDGPEARVLDATVAGDGVRAPRFVLARLASGTLLGVACQTHQISQDMCSDGSRPVPCFIGWLSSDKRVAVPQFDAVESGWVTWAAAEYESWLRPVWTESTGRVRETDRTRELRPPWELTRTVPDTDPWDRSEFEEPTRDGIRVYPATDAARVWRGIDRYGLNATVVTGWHSVRTALNRGLTHACVAEFQGPAQIYRLSPEKPAGQTQAGGRTWPSRDDAYGGTASAHGAGTPAHGKRSAEPGWGHGVSRGPNAGYAAEDRQAGSGRSGLLGGLRRAAQDLASSVMGGDSAPGRPPAPPAGESDWTLRLDQGRFTARQDGYVFSYRIGDPAIVCWYDGSDDEALRWTGAGWAPLTPAQPPRERPRQPEPRQPEPRQPEPQQPEPQQTTSGYQPAGTAPPKVAGRPPGSPVFHSPAAERSKTYGTPFDEFEDAPLPGSRPVLPDEEPAGEQGEPTQDDPTQTTPPEWSPEEE